MNKDKEIVTPNGNPLKENEIVIFKVHSTYKNAYYDSIVFKTGEIFDDEGIKKRDTSIFETFYPQNP